MPYARLIRWMLITAAVFLTACSAPRPKPGPLPRFTAPSPHHSDITPNDILFRAIALVGTPYHYGGNTPESGFDCSGFVDYVFRDVAGIVLPRTVDDIDAINTPDVRRDELNSGDLIFFHTNGRKVSHIGIYVGEGRFVHAPNEGGTVRLDRLDNVYWDAHYSGAKRIPL
jgi:cell wall-associated NlpC family hydrolase